HGGSLTSGDKTDSNWPIFCQAFAKRGYVAASINYRLGIASPTTPKTVLEAFWRAQQDLRAAIRFARAAATTHKINANRIFIIGNSAGGATCMNVAYVDNNEVPVVIDQTTWGNLEGNSGSPGFSSMANAAISLWGNIGDTSWMSQNNIPVGLIHSINDPVAPYYSAFNPPTGTNSYGGFSIHQRAKNLNIKTDLKTYYYQGHDIGLDNPVYLDSTISFTSNFLYSFAR
ncbi:MAG: alpha/beta hydrolase, partial [Chitinophagaceae bacterium]